MNNQALHLPPEWSTQWAILITWPHEHSDWADNLAAVEQEFLQLAQAIAAQQRLIIICFDNPHQLHVQQQLSKVAADLAQIHFYFAPSNDSWARDHGPITVLTADKQAILYDFKFNGWGDKYPAELDNHITSKLVQQNAFANYQCQPQEIILEGGSIEVNGNGSLLTTSHCLLQRNNFSKTQWQDTFKKLFGIKQVLWLDHGVLAGDDTDSHIDTLVRFVANDHICYVQCDAPQNPHYDPLQLMAEQLKQFHDLQGQPFKLTPLPWPQAQYNNEGERLPLSYANFLIINNAVLVPQYGDKCDKIAQQVLAGLFPKRQIIGIDSQEMIKQRGSLHCLTMQIPKII